MKLRLFAIAVFLLGLSSFGISLFLVGPIDVAQRNPEFAAATTLVTDENYADIVLASQKPFVLDSLCTVFRRRSNRPRSRLFFLAS